MTSQKLKDQMDAFCQRASKHTGWKFQWTIEPGVTGVPLLKIFDTEKDNAPTYVFGLCHRFGGVKEVYGRLRNVPAYVEDVMLIEQVLKEQEKKE